MEIETEAHFKAYEEHMKTLRAWFVAYGVGGPILFVTQEHFAKRLLESGELFWLTLFFFGGVGLQIFIAAINKWVNWYIYFADKNNITDGPWFTVTSKISRMFWLDIVCDIGSAALFAAATIKVFYVFSN